MAIGICKITYEKTCTKGFKRKDVSPILQIDDNGNLLKEWRTMTEAEDILGLYHGAISRVISGKYKHSKNLFFKSA